MGKIISLANQKGGVGKTTTTINLGASLATLEKRVLIVDADPQANASSGLGVDIKQSKCTIYECMINGADIHSAIHDTAIDNGWVNTTRFQHCPHQRCGCCLAMRPRNRHGPFQAHQFRQHLGTLHNRNTF